MTDKVVVYTKAPAASAWQNFWFVADPNSSSLRVVKIGLSVVAAWYFASHWSDIGTWFASDGVLATATLSEFIEAADVTDSAQWRCSPLYLTGSITLLRLYLLIGIMLAIAAAWQRRSRLPGIFLWLWCVWLANRSFLISGPEEIALVFGLAYIAIASPHEARHWSAGLARRLIQVHTAILIGATGLTMLSSAVWWDGTGSFAVAAPIGRRLFNLTDLLSSPGLHEPLTHVLVITAIAAPIAIWLRRTQWLAYCSLIVWCVVMGLLSSQWMYVSTIAVLLQSFRLRAEI